MSAEWTAQNGQCFFGNRSHPEEGYARKDEHGEFQPACFEHARQPYPQPVPFVNKGAKSEFD